MIKRIIPFILTALLFSCSADDYTSEYKDNVKVRLSISSYKYDDADTRKCAGEALSDYSGETADFCAVVQRPVNQRNAREKPQHQ